MAAALASLVAVAHSSPALRPRYGGTARIEVPGVVPTPDPAAALADVEAAAARDALLPLVFETLTRAGGTGLQPLLADSWQSEAGDRRWRVHLRPAVKLHDGTPLTAALVTQSLNNATSGWTAKEAGDAVVIESDRPLPDLPWQLADLRHAIVVKGQSALPLGTGPFRLERWEPGRRLVLAANDGYRGGRPFLDAAQIEMARSVREEIADLEAGRADLVALSPPDVRRVLQRALRVQTSRPLELVALVFDTRRPGGSQESLRAAAAGAIDRSAICATLLQGQARAADALLPEWLSGYASILGARRDPATARTIVASLPAGRHALSLEYDAADALVQVVADRVAVDLREAGLAIMMTTASRLAAAPPDGRLVHAFLQPTTPDRALAALLAPLGLAAADAPAAGSALEDTARFEQALLERSVVVPLVHVPRIYALGGRLQSSNGPLVTQTGRLNLADAWLHEEKP